MRIEQVGEGDPEIAVVGGVHGDEPCGIAAVEHFLDRQPELDRPVLFVVANEEAAAAGERFLERDMNRSFPGDPDGALEDRLAYALGDAIGDCTTLALHSTQSYDRMFALIDELRPFSREICPRLSVDAVVETGAAEGRIFDAVPDTIEVECGYQGSEQAAENAVEVTREFLAATGALPTEGEPPEGDLPVFKLGDPIPKADADEYEVYAENFQEVLAGERFASADGEAVVADRAFHPVLMSAYGYEKVFGYTAERVGTLSA
jgi:predicted deacylase